MGNRKSAMTVKPKIAFLFDRMAPYYAARLNAASRYAEIISIEFSELGQTYAWDAVKTPCTFQRVVLFSDAPISLQPFNAVLKRMSHVLDEIKPQVVAIPGWDYPPMLMGLWWSLHNHTPTILISDSQKHDEKRVWWREWIKAQVVRLYSSGFVAGSPHVDYLKSLGMPEKNIFTGVDVVDNDFFAEGAKECQQDAAVARKRLGLPKKYFLASSRFVPKKNLFMLLKAYASYCERGLKDHWKLVLLGDGQFKQQIIEHRDELGLSDDVVFPGFKQYHELPVYYGLAGAFIHASIADQWGLVVNEAMACGLPVIVSAPCGCSPDLVKNAVNGFIFDPNNSDELADLMVFISSDTCNRAKMGQASRDIIGCWSLDTFASNLVHAAHKALEAPEPRLEPVSKVLLWGLMNRKRYL